MSYRDVEDALICQKETRFTSVSTNTFGETSETREIRDVSAKGNLFSFFIYPAEFNQENSSEWYEAVRKIATFDRKI